MRKSRLFLVICIIIGFSTSSFSQKLDNNSRTTSGTQENTSAVGGLTDEEWSDIEKSNRDLKRKVIEGRAEYFIDGRSRQATIMEIHDQNLDGIVDHLNADGSIQEQGTLKAAIGDNPPPETNEAARIIAVDKAKANAGNCKEGKDGKYLCRNISAIIVDAGAAHGEDSSHRVYELTDKAQKNAKDAANQYSKKTLEDSSQYGNIDGQFVVGSRQGQVQLANGTSVAVAPNIDVLKSEVAWLETQKRRNINTTWRTLRATRLVTRNTSEAGSVDNEMSDLILKGANDEVLAQRISARSSGLNGVLVCEGPKNVWNLCGENQKSSSNKSTIGSLESKGVNQNRIQELLREAESKQSPEQKKKLQAEMNNIKNCLKRDTWCDETFQPVKGDPGNAFNDTRELVYSQLETAQDAPLDQFQNIMSSADFNQGTDRKTKTLPYQQMVKEIQAAQKSAKELQELNKKSGGPNIDPRKQSTVQMFGRCYYRNRDGSCQDGSTLGKGANTAPSQTGPRPSSSGQKTNTPPLRQRGPF